MVKKIIEELIESKAGCVLKHLPDEGREWTPHFAFFARTGFTSAAQDYAGEHNVLRVDLSRLDRDLD